MIMSSTTKEEKWDIYRRFDQMVRGEGEDIKLCYITVCRLVEPLARIAPLTISQPERMAKDKTFVSKLQKLSEAKKLGACVFTNFL